MCFTNPCQAERVRFLSFCSTKINNRRPKLVINPAQGPRDEDSFCWWMMVQLTQEGSWKWILAIILIPMSWLVAGMVSWCSCLSGSLSQNPGMVSKCVDVRAQCHLGTWIDELMAITLYRIQMDRKTSLAPTVAAAPNPSVKDGWLRVHHHPWFPKCGPESVETELTFIMIPLSHTQSNLAMGHKLIMV